MSNEINPLPTKESCQSILYPILNSFTNRSIPTTAALMYYFYSYKWESYAKTYKIIGDIRKMYLDHKAKGILNSTNENLVK